MYRTLLGLAASINIASSGAFAQPAATPALTPSATATPDVQPKPAPAIDLQNPTLLEGLKQIEGFWPEDFAKTVQGKTGSEFAVTPASSFFAPLDAAALTTRQTGNAKYTPFKGDILPPWDGEVILGMMEHRTTLTLESGKKIVADHIVGAILPNTNFLHVTYGPSPEHGENWHTPKNVRVSEAIYAVPIIRADKPTGRYIVIMPMRDAAYADIISTGAAYGDYVIQQVTTLIGEKTPPVPAKDEKSDSLAGGVESYGDMVYLDPDQLNARFKKSSGPTNITRPLALTDVHTVDMNGTTVVVGLGTEITDARNAFVLPLRVAVAAKQAIFTLHNNNVPKTAESISIGIAEGGDTTKLQGYVIIRNMKATQKAAAR